MSILFFLYCYFDTAIQHILDPLKPELFVSFTYTFKFYCPVFCFYSKICPLFIDVFLLPSGPNWDIIANSGDYICHFRPYHTLTLLTESGKNKINRCCV